MTIFEDGPAKGQVLMLSRAPYFLRVTQEGKTFDALDLLDDEPRLSETLLCYEQVGTPGVVHINRGRKGGGFYAMANYRFRAIQPADSDMRTLAAWIEWVRVNHPKKL